DLGAAKAEGSGLGRSRRDSRGSRSSLIVPRCFLFLPSPHEAGRHGRHPRPTTSRPGGLRVSSPTVSTSPYANEAFFHQLLGKAIAAKASDVHIKVGQPPGARVRGDMV